MPAFTQKDEKEGFQPLFLPCNAVVSILDSSPQQETWLTTAHGLNVPTLKQHQKEGLFWLVGKFIGRIISSNSCKDAKILFPKDRRSWAGNDKCLLWIGFQQKGKNIIKKKFWLKLFEWIDS